MNLLAIGAKPIIPERDDVYTRLNSLTEEVSDVGTRLGDEFVLRSVGNPYAWWLLK